MHARRRIAAAEVADFGGDAVERVAVVDVGDRLVHPAAIWRISSSFMPRVVTDGVPMRRPLGLNGLRGSKGIVL